MTVPSTSKREVEAENEEIAISMARDIALDTPYEDWGDDFSYATLEIVEE